ncbi:MAG: beta-N-acetylhexosaminidase [Ruminococcaceae bacterium]|nr:beta-N-acetylhexosaminidase [Oscillospiraceae bacterium]
MDQRSLGIMLDCSRNSVMTPDKVKEFATLIAGMGYNMLQLYTEDTYEIDGEPFFGYMRGRYSKEELKDIDAHCASHGIELIPCIQTLAHLERISRWPAYADLFDIEDVLLVDDDRVYQLIDKMFATLKECFTSRRVHIGMDEAHNLGLGNYLKKHGLQNRTLLMAMHLTRVKEIAQKHGFQPMLWSDMFLRLHNNGTYYGDDIRIPQETIDAVPADVELVYWDYYSKEKIHFDNMLRIHEKFVNNSIVFAGGIWTWSGYVPNLRYSLDVIEASMRSVREHSVSTILFTMWGDNGADCARFSALPGIFAAAEMARGNFDRADIARKFEAYTGYRFDEFMDLELPNLIGDNESINNNPNKYLLFNDPFIGLFDFTVSDNLSALYADYAKQLAPSVNGRKYDYLFRFTTKLLEVLSVKCDLGIRLRKAYGANDKQALRHFADVEIPMLIGLVDELYVSYRTQWLTENKPFGLEVQENRFGGLLLRLRSCKDRLVNYLDGRINIIEELEEKQEGFLDSNCKRIRFNAFGRTYTACGH